MYVWSLDRGLGVLDLEECTRISSRVEKTIGG